MFSAIGKYFFLASYHLRLPFDDGDWQENLGKMKMYASVNPWKPRNTKPKQKMIMDLNWKVLLLEFILIISDSREISFFESSTWLECRVNLSNGRYGLSEL